MKNSGFTTKTDEYLLVTEKCNVSKQTNQQTLQSETNEQIVAKIQDGIDTADNMLLLWQQNAGFINNMAKKYQGYAELDDLTQEGYFGLCEAVRQYDPERSVPFINYAAFWIRQAMQRYIDNCCSVVRLPVGASTYIRKYKKAVSEYRKYYGCEPSERALCAMLDVGREKLHDIQKSSKMGQIDSLSRVIGGDDEDITISDTLASDEVLEEDCIQRLDRENMSRELWIAVDQLPDNLPEAIRHRYLDGMTLKEVGQNMGIGIERVRQLQNKAFRMLRTERRGSKLRIYHEEYLSAAPIHHVGVESFNRTWMSEVEREALRAIERYGASVSGTL